MKNKKTYVGIIFILIFVLGVLAYFGAMSLFYNSTDTDKDIFTMHYLFRGCLAVTIGLIYPVYLVYFKKKDKQNNLDK